MVNTYFKRIFVFVFVDLNIFASYKALNDV